MKKTLSGEPDMALVGEANNVVELFTQLDQVPVNVVLLDITMQGKRPGRLEGTAPETPPCARAHPQLSPEHRFAVRAFKAGASGYITKESATVDWYTRSAGWLSGVCMSALRWPSNWPGAQGRHWQTAARSALRPRVSGDASICFG